ncbi:hypothetical protein ABFS82_13G113800 [Erythranthe guttata]
MVSANSTATRSSLELMLDKLQLVDDQPSENIPPALPVRPVSRARLPRATKSLMQLDHLQMKRELVENSKRLVAEKGISNIQKCYRGHRIRCGYKELTRGAIALQSYIRGENARIQNRSPCNETTHEHPSSEISADTKVTYSFLVDLRTRVLRTEAKVRGKQEENNALKIQLEELDKKRQKYEERMKSKEKEWQDQFTYIQECLAEAAKAKNRDPEIRNDDRNMDANTMRSMDYNELKLRFKEWKKEYKIKLREINSIFKKIGNSETGKSQHMKWWGRLSS